MIALEGKISVRGIILPNSDFTGCDEEVVSTALGYVCHMLDLVSRWLEVPMPYPLIPFGSRSLIRDEISEKYSQAPRFPLYYTRGVDRTRFEYGVFLLNKDLEQLLNSQGLSIITLRHTLPNLLRLLTRTGTESAVL